jgi:deazaflavin-dependent oxidoreductase (nitroreductase family)
MDLSRYGSKNKKPNALQKLIHRFLVLKPVSVVLSKVLHRADSAMLQLSGGRHTFAELVGLPIIQLTTIGARTNQPRTRPLVGLIEEEKIALIASNFGQKHNPGWYHNLKKYPECEVVFNGTSGRYLARELAGDEYHHYWQVALSYYAGYEKYKQRAAHRYIPVMLLELKN